MAGGRFTKFVQVRALNLGDESEKLQNSEQSKTIAYALYCFCYGSKEFLKIPLDTGWINGKKFVIV